MKMIQQLVLDEEKESIEEIARLSNCKYSECVLKLKYLMNKRVLDGYYIDKINKTIKTCSVEDSNLVKKYSDFIYQKNLQIDEMAKEIPNYNNKPLQILEEDIYRDIKYMYDKSLINGIKIDETNKKIIYYTVEKKKTAQWCVTLNCPNCGALVNVPKKNSEKCSYCNTVVNDNTNGKFE